MINKEDDIIRDIKTEIEAPKQPPVDESVFTGEKTEVAGRGKFLKDVIIESVGGKRIIQGEVKQGSKLPHEKKVIEQTDPVPQEVPQDQPKTIATEEDIKAVADRQEELLNEGVPSTAKSPTKKQKGEGVVQARITTVRTTDEEKRAIELAQWERLSKNPEITKTTIKDLREQALDMGITQQEIDRVLQGKKLTAKIGDYDLSKRIAALKGEYDANLEIISQGIDKYQTARLDSLEKYNLLVAMTNNSQIAADLTQSGREIGTALNAFKSIKNLGGNVQLSDIDEVLSQHWSDNSFERMIKMYEQAQTNAQRAKILNSTGGNLERWFDSAYYTFQANLLSSPTTWMDNFVGSFMHGSLMTVEDIVAASVVRPIRKGVEKITRTAPKELPQEIEELDDVLVGMTGIWDGLKDGLHNAAHVIKTGERAGFKGEKFQPISSDMLKTNNGSSKLARAISQSELATNWVGKLLDAVGFVQSVPMRALAAGDEIIGSTFSRMRLNTEMNKYGKKRLKELRAAGLNEQEVKDALVKEMTQFVDTQPAEIFDNVKEVKDMIQFTYKWDRTKRLDKAYASVNAFLNKPVVRFMTPFANTLTKIVDQTASRIPGMNFISPQFYKDVSRGGRHADRAIARLSVGTLGMYYAFEGTANNVLTGSGPTDPTQRRALMQTGWQPYAIRLKKDGVPGKIIKQFERLTNVTQTDDEYFISYQRFDMVAQVLAMGADMWDAMKFANEDPSAEVWEEMLLAYGTSSGEFMSNLPVMQFVGELSDISSGNYETQAERYLDLMERMMIHTGKTIVMATPVAGWTQSTLAYQIAKTLDKDNPLQKGPDAPMIKKGISDSASAAIDRIQNDLIARTPVLRGEYDKDRDEAGRLIYNKNTIHQNWLNLIPSARISSSIHSEMDQVLADNYMGISIPSSTWDDVTLSSEQYTMYKYLYGQKLNLTQVSPTGEIELMNMEKAIPNNVKRLTEEFAMLGEVPQPEDIRNEINSTISAYRKEAKRVMLGDSMNVDDTGLTTQTRYTGSYIDMDGVEQSAMYPDLVRLINKSKTFKRASKRP